MGISAVTISAEDVIRILAIGNSFSEDAVEQNLREICAPQGIGVEIANLFIPACTIDMHYSNLTNNTPTYSYRKISVDGIKTTTENVTLETALHDGEWNYISFQQASKDSGIFSTFTSLGDFIRRVRLIVGRHPIFCWHSTWAYAPGSNHAGFKAYGNNELQMYHDIVSTSRKVMRKFPQLKILIPTGTAIQDARTAIIAGKDLTRDGYHLELTIGRYIAACTWYEAIFRTPFKENTFFPKTVTPEDAKIAWKVAEIAVKYPYEITPILP
ncbi:MAG: DUF4886 domain-containing protein [Prevotella sp.]|nr:DUF4886 domain-containing protein [Prevotella sp.]